MHCNSLQLRYVEFDQVPAFPGGGMLAWGSSGLPICHVPVISAGQAHCLISTGDAVPDDVRSTEEWEAGHDDGLIHISWHNLGSRNSKLDPARHTIVMCKGGQRGTSRQPSC